MNSLPEIPDEFKNHPALVFERVPSKYSVRRVLDEPLPGATGEAEAAINALAKAVGAGRAISRPLTEIELWQEQTGFSPFDNLAELSEAERYCAPLEHAVNEIVARGIEGPCVGWEGAGGGGSDCGAKATGDDAGGGPEAGGEACRFLAQFFGNEPWPLIAIQPGENGKSIIKAKTFPAGSGRAALVEKWIKDKNRASEIYFAVNPIKPNCALDKKADKNDVAAAQWLFVDQDPPDHSYDTDPVKLAAWRETKLAAFKTYPGGIPGWPTVILDSGRGFWLFWKLKEAHPVDGWADAATKTNGLLTEAVEARGRGVEKAYGADNVRNIDRIARLPGTVNHRTGQRARAIEFEPSRTYDLTAFPEGPATGAGAGGGNKSGARDQTASAKAARLGWRIIQGGKTREDMEKAIRDDPETSPWYNKHAQLGDVQRQLDRIFAAADARFGGFIRDEKGRVIKTRANVLVALEKMKIKISYNEFSCDETITGLRDFGPRIDDAVINRLWLSLQDRYNLFVAYDAFNRMISDIARDRRFHPVKDYLNSLRGLGRRAGVSIDTWLIDFAGAKDTPLVRAYGAKWLLAGVARIFDPGCKFDQTLNLIGDEGINKSTALKRLAHKPEWFSDSLPLGETDKKFIEQTLGKSILEFSDLIGLNSGKEVEKVTSSLSRCEDRARLAYDRRRSDILRQFITAGSTNALQFLTKKTGNRRWWSVGIIRFDLDRFTDDVVNHLWAEALQRYLNGESIVLPESLWAEAAKEQESRLVGSCIEDELRHALGGKDGPSGAILSTALREYLALRDIRNPANRDLNDSLSRLGFKSIHLRFAGKPESCWLRRDKETLEFDKVESVQDFRSMIEYRLWIWACKHDWPRKAKLTFTEWKHTDAGKSARVDVEAGRDLDEMKAERRERKEAPRMDSEIVDEDIPM